MATQRPSFQRADTDVAPSPRDSEKDRANSTEKIDAQSAEHGAIPPSYTGDREDVGEFRMHVSTAEDLVTEVLHVEDDPSLNPWTFRMFFLGTDYT